MLGSENEEMVKKVLTMMRGCSYKGSSENIIPMYRFTFFLGAGFSKSWDDKFPLGKDLFNIDFDDYNNDTNLVAARDYIRDCGYEQKLDYDSFVACYYKLQMMKNNDFLQGRYYDKYNLERIDSEFRYLVTKILHHRIDSDYVEDGDSTRLATKARTDEQKLILDFFDDMLMQLDGSNGIPEGIRVNFLTTNYDYVVESIIDEHYKSMGDFHYINTYRGFTPKKINDEPNISPFYDESLVNSIIKLNGGTEIYFENNGFSINHRNPASVNTPENPPQIILPSKEQIYESDYFKTIFPKAVRILQETDVLFVIGYSFPKEDGLIGFLLNQFAESLRDIYDKQLFYIDIAPDPGTLKGKIKNVFPHINSKTTFANVYSRGFLNFVKDYLENQKTG